MMSAQEAAAALGGIATSPQSLLCPGPGHSPCDRSLSVRFDSAAPDGFLVHSFTGDDQISCRDHVRAALGLGLWRDRREQAANLRKVRKPAPASEKPTEGPEEATRVGWALRIWAEARDPRGTVVEGYLTGRGLELPDDVAFAPCAITPRSATRAAALRPAWSRFARSAHGRAGGHPPHLPRPRRREAR